MAPLLTIPLDDLARVRKDCERFAHKRMAALAGWLAVEPYSSPHAVLARVVSCGAGKMWEYACNTSMFFREFSARRGFADVAAPRAWVG